MSDHARPAEPTAATPAAGWLARCRHLLHDRGGAVAIYFVLTLIPLMVATGAALDISRAYLVKQRLCSALDAAGLAVGSASGTQEQLNAVLQAFFAANYPRSEIGTPTTPVLTQNGNVLTVSAEATVETTLMKVIGVNSTTVGCFAQVTKSAKSLEVALVLDITGSMAGQRLADMKLAAKDLVDLVIQDVQAPVYTKIALVPYSNAVNVGTYASQVRGPIAPAKPITNVQWFKRPDAQNMPGCFGFQTQTEIQRIRPRPTSCRILASASNLGFIPGDFIHVRGTSNVTGVRFDPATNVTYQVGSVQNTEFELRHANGGNLDLAFLVPSLYSTNTRARVCHVAACAPVVTAAAHGFATNARVVITEVGGTTQINNRIFTVTNRTANTFSIPVNPFAPALTNYTSGGKAWCTTPGCEFFLLTRFNSAFRITTCVTERSGVDAFTDTAPSIARLGRHYELDACVRPTIQPLTADKAALKAVIDSFTAAGPTAGHIGTAWGWYMLSPDFGYLWPSDSRPAAYGAPNVDKIVVLMTDGDFNTTYCNGVPAGVSCFSPNGDPSSQALRLCTNMKAKGIILYTVGFNVNGGSATLLRSCATDTAHAFFPVTGAELKASFQSIAQSIGNLRLSK